MLQNVPQGDQKFSARNGGPSFFAMDEAFCARMLAAIEAGLQSAPIGVVTTLEQKTPNTFPQSLGR